MDDGIDIYEDLPSFNTNDVENCSTNATEVAGKCDELTKQVNELTEKVKKLEKDNEILEVNLSSLLKTAKAEIARKDRMIADLREQLDNALFRRAGNRVPYSQPRIKKESNPQPVKQQKFIQKPQYTINHVHTTENEVTSTDIDYSTAIEEEYSEKKAVEAQKKLQETVYGKRLRKRIMEIENEEAKEANKKHNESVGSSVVESNKENAIVNKIDTDTDASVCAAKSCVGESKKESDLNQNVDEKTGHFQAIQKSSSTNTTSLPVDEVANKCSTAVQSVEISGKRPNEDAVSLPSSKRRKNNEEELHCNVQYSSQSVGSQLSSSVNVTSKSNFESKHSYHEGKSHDKYDRHNYERRHFSRRDADDKRDNYRHRDTNRRPTSRSRERSRERSKERNNYREKSREISSHYEHDKSYHSRGSDRKYSHKSYDRHYSNDHRTFKSNSRKQDVFKEKDSGSCKPLNRNGYDLRDKVENRYEKKSDYIYYESSKYKRNNRYGTETPSRSGKSLSETKEEVASSKPSENSTENMKLELKEIKESKSEIEDKPTSKDRGSVKDVNALEEGEVRDTPTSTPIKTDTNNSESLPEIIQTEQRDPVEKTTPEIKSNDSTTKLDTSAREEVIENIKQFIQNYDEQEFSKEKSNTDKQSNADTLKCDNDKIENVVNVLTMDDDVNASEREKDPNKKHKEDVVDRDDKSLQHNHIHIAASISQITQKSKVKYRIPKIKSQESVQLTDKVIRDKSSNIPLSNVDNTTFKLPCKLEETTKLDTTDKSTASSDVNILNAKSTNDTPEISTVNVNNDIRSDKECTAKQQSLTDRHIDDNVNELKIEKDNLEGLSLCNKEITAEEKTLENDKVVTLECTKVNISVDSPKIANDVCATDKEPVNSGRASVVNSTEENKLDNCRDNKQIKACPSSSLKTNESKCVNNDRSKVIVARRRKPVQLGDMNASMTIVMSQSAVKTSDNVNIVSESSNTLKPRACKVSRSYKKVN